MFPLSLTTVKCPSCRLSQTLDHQIRTTTVRLVHWMMCTFIFKPNRRSKSGRHYLAWRAVVWRRADGNKIMCPAESEIKVASERHFKVDLGNCVSLSLSRHAPQRHAFALVQQSAPFICYINNNSNNKENSENRLETRRRFEFLRNGGNINKLTTQGISYLKAGVYYLTVPIVLGLGLQSIDFTRIFTPSN